MFKSIQDLTLSIPGGGAALLDLDSLTEDRENLICQLAFLQGTCDNKDADKLLGSSMSSFGHTAILSVTHATVFCLDKIWDRRTARIPSTIEWLQKNIDEVFSVRRKAHLTSNDNVLETRTLRGAVEATRLEAEMLRTSDLRKNIRLFKTEHLNHATPDGRSHDREYYLTTGHTPKGDTHAELKAFGMDTLKVIDDLEMFVTFRGTATDKHLAALTNQTKTFWQRLPDFSSVEHENGPFCTD